MDILHYFTCFTTAFGGTPTLIIEHLKANPCFSHRFPPSPPLLLYLPVSLSPSPSPSSFSFPSPTPPSLSPLLPSFLPPSLEEKKKRRRRLEGSGVEGSAVTPWRWHYLSGEWPDATLSPLVLSVVCYQEGDGDNAQAQLSPSNLVIPSTVVVWELAEMPCV